MINLAYKICYCCCFFIAKGFKEAESACCGSGPYRGISSCGGKRVMTEFFLCENPSEYLFFDSSHFTEKAYQQFAEHSWNEKSYNLKVLFESN